MVTSTLSMRAPSISTISIELFERSAHDGNAFEQIEISPLSCVVVVLVVKLFSVESFPEREIIGHCPSTR